MGIRKLPIRLAILQVALVKAFVPFVPPKPRVVRFTCDYLDEPSTMTVQKRRPLPLHSVPDACGKYFQLEELEDKDTSTTEVYLNADHTVALGETDGPLPINFSALWEQTEGQFRMTISRTFPGGTPEKSPTDIGEFSFDVVRHYEGEIKLIGEVMSISGSMSSSDLPSGPSEIGYFNMIETTEERMKSYGND